MRLLKIATERLDAVRKGSATRRDKRGKNRENTKPVGILVIHGIGPQRHGQTVSDVMGCLEAAVDQGGDVGIVPHDLDSGEIRGRISLSGKRPIDLLAREAYWDQNVTAPAPGAVLLWCLLSLPIFLLQSAMAWGLRHMDHHPLPDSKLPRHEVSFIEFLKAFVVSLLPMLTAFLLAIGLAPIALIALALFTLLYLLLRILGKKSRLLMSINRILTAYIGDAWIYVSETQEESMVGFASAALRDLKSECREVYVIAHSQGAEIARRAILRGELPSGFVSVGSGENQLALPRIVRRNWGC